MKYTWNAPVSTCNRSLAMNPPVSTCNAPAGQQRGDCCLIGIRSYTENPITTLDMVKQTKAKTFQAYLDSCHRRYSCVHCRAHLANHDDLISKSFQGSQGRAYLFNSVVNNCHTTLGWKYEQAFELSQKYKEGKFIIELSHMIKDNGWD
ncbi:hypothetical protein J4Q44_G00170120 [Coregonus suidteri]|uniref:Yippee domain-containing protein n=1 Tax=Coregonus suidteri TaxID=861788 RepID=A0AAN8LIC6_9TELE